MTSSPRCELIFDIIISETCTDMICMHNNLRSTASAFVRAERTSGMQGAVEPKRPRLAVFLATMRKLTTKQLPSCQISVLRSWHKQICRLWWSYKFYPPTITTHPRDERLPRHFHAQFIETGYQLFSVVSSFVSYFGKTAADCASTV